MKTAKEILKEGNEGSSIRDILDNLTNSQIFDTYEEYANQFKPKWIPVSERLPEVGQWCLCYYNHGYNFDLYQYDQYSKYWIDRQGDYYKNITHWMPLPEPPTNP